MRLCGVATHHHDGLGITDVVVAVRHRAITPGVGDPGDRGGVTDTRLMIGIIGAPEGCELAVEVGGFIGEFGRAQPVHRVRSRLLADFQKFVADLVDGLFPGDAGPLAIHELYRIAQAALAQYIVSDRCTLAAMRATVDWTVVIWLLAYPYPICDFGDNRATDRTMRADILPRRNRRARGRWRTRL